MSDADTINYYELTATEIAAVRKLERSGKTLAQAIAKVLPRLAKKEWQYIDQIDTLVWSN